MIVRKTIYWSGWHVGLRLDPVYAVAINAVLERHGAEVSQGMDADHPYCYLKLPLGTIADVIGNVATVSLPTGYIFYVHNFGSELPSFMFKKDTLPPFRWDPPLITRTR